MGKPKKPEPELPSDGYRPRYNQHPTFPWLWKCDCCKSVEWRDESLFTSEEGPGARFCDVGLRKMERIKQGLCSPGKSAAASAAKGTHTRKKKNLANAWAQLERYKLKLRAELTERGVPQWEQYGAIQVQVEAAAKHLGIVGYVH